MADKTGIEWTDATWNPTTGCDQVSPGCDNCYALTQAKRLKAMGSARYQTDGDPRTSGPGFGLTMHEDALDQPLRWTKPRRIFVNSMSDLFHPRVTDEFIARVFAVMACTPRHTFQVLTKRPARMRSLLRSGKFANRFEVMIDELLPWSHAPLPSKDHYLASQHMMTRWDRPGATVADHMPPLPNVWLGVSVEDQQRADERIPRLLDTPAAVRFLSCEPLLGPVDLTRWLNGGFGRVAPDLHWVIAGGESGKGARPMHPDWARTLRDQCNAAGVPFLFKQWGEWVVEDQSPQDIILPASCNLLLGDPGPCFYKVGKHKAGRELDGRTWDEYPHG